MCPLSWNCHVQSQPLSTDSRWRLEKKSILFPLNELGRRRTKMRSSTGRARSEIQTGAFTRQLVGVSDFRCILPLLTRFGQRREACTGKWSAHERRWTLHRTFAGAVRWPLRCTRLDLMATVRKAKQAIHGIGRLRA